MKRKRPKDTSTSESPAKSKPRTSNDKSPSSTIVIPTTASSPTLVPASTSRDPALEPYWNDRVAAWSGRLSSPSGTGFAASRTTSYPTYSRSSWFSQTQTPHPPAFRNCLRISLPPIPSSSAECKGGGSPNTDEQEKKKRPKPTKSSRRAKRITKAPLTRSLKVRLYPNNTQKSLLRQWMGCARLVYNMVVANYIRNRRATAQFFFRVLLKHKIRTTREWSFMANVPYEVLDHAISGAISARDEVITRNRERVQSGDGSYNRLAFRRKKDPRNTITIRSQYCRSDMRFYVRLLHNETIVAADRLGSRKKDECDIPKLFRPPLHHERMRRNHNWPNAEGLACMDSSLTYDKRLRQWTFNWVYGKDVRDGEIQADPVIAAVDPGVVTFATWYSPTLGTGTIGTRDIERIIRLCLNLDGLISKTGKVRAEKRNAHRRAQARIRQKIRNLVDEMHKKVALWAVRTFDVIVLPVFGAARMSLRKPGRRLNRKTVRMMLTWSHARFRQRLLSKAEEYGKVIITSVSEAYTSKTCTACGHVHPRLGGARVFRCSSCGVVMDRDANAAKGILLRALASGALSAPETSVDEGFA